MSATALSWSVPVGVGIGMTGWNSYMRRRDSLRSQIHTLSDKVEKQGEDLTRLTRFVVGSSGSDGYPATTGLLGRLTKLEGGLLEIRDLLLKVDRNTGGG